MQELLEDRDALNPEKAVEILRNKEGLGGENIGFGNEKAINQLLAHHGIIFKPEERKVWISSNPYQLGTFVAYDLDDAFETFKNSGYLKSVATDEFIIPEDKFLHTIKFRNYEKFRALNEEILSKRYNVEESKINKLISLNPDNWETWAVAGEYYFHKKDFKKAVVHFKQAQKREVTTKPDEKWLEKRIKKSYRKF